MTDSTQPALPLDIGRPATRTHDDQRHGTTSLFAALDVATGKVIGALKPRHRAEEFIGFLNAIDKDVPADLDVHLITQVRQFGQPHRLTRQAG